MAEVSIADAQPEPEPPSRVQVWTVMDGFVEVTRVDQGLSLVVPEDVIDVVCALIDYLPDDAVVPVRDRLAARDPRVQAEDIHHWTVEPGDVGDVYLWAWISEDDPRPEAMRLRPGGLRSQLIWRATLAGLGLRDAE